MGEDPIHIGSRGEEPSPLKLPGNKRLRPFFVMKLIEKSMIAPEGAFVTEDLFVPKYVWYQRDAKIQDVDSKI